MRLMKTLKTVIFSVAAVSLLLSSETMCSSKTAENYSMKLGKFEVISLLDLSSVMKSDLVKNGDPALIKKYMPEGELKSSINVFVVKTGKQNIMIDSGLGTEGSRKGKMLENMKKAGLKPDDIDIILITHAHLDHVGGLINNGKAVFPKAKLFFSKNEIAAFDDNAIKSLPSNMKSYFETANKALKIYSGRVESFVPGGVITEGVTSVKMSGHTPGHVGYLFESEGERLLMAGDFLHITLMQFPHPEISLVYDKDINRAAEVRKMILNRASSEGFFIAGAHIIFPGIGHVMKEGDGFSFKPVK